MASNETPEEVIARIAELLGRAGVPYMLTGSFASGFHGAPRASHDVDFVIAPVLGTLEAFLNLLPPDSYYVSREAALQAYGAESLFNVVDFATAWKIDLIIRKSRLFSQTEFERRTTVRLGEVELCIATAEDVLIAKLEWAKLTESERQLEDAAGILRVQGDDLDVEYVEKWTAALGLGSQLVVARSRAGLSGQPR
jgi:hypothetical protein